MAELADAQRSGRCGIYPVEVRVLFPAPGKTLGWIDELYKWNWRLVFSGSRSEKIKEMVH